MSHISSDQRPSAAAFTRAYVWVVVVLVALSGVLVVVGYFQGPKLADAQLDATSAITQPNQQLRLFANQQLQEVTAEQVTVTPPVEVSVSTAGDVIAVQFAAPLLYATDYTVTVSDVRSVSLPQPATLEYSFTTPAPTPLYLDRGDLVDEIVRTSLTGSERTVVFTGKHIQSFATTGQVVIVASTAEEGTSRLDVVSLVDGAVENIRLPAEGLISDLATSSVGSIVGFTFTPTVRDPDDVLGGRRVLLLNLESGRELTTVGDLGGDALPVTDWRFIPGTTALVVQGIEQTVFVVDAAPESIPTPIGRFTELVSVSRDGRTLAARDGLGGVFVNLADGTQTRFDPSLIQGGLPFLGQVEQLANGDVIEKAALQTTDGRFAVVIAVDDGTEGRILYQTPDLAGSIEDFTVSPNGQYVAIEVVPVVADAVSDGYPTNPRATSITTVIVDIQSGLIVRSVEGFGWLW